MEKELRNHIAADNHRLDRIEQKIDKLAETVISLARAEEKLIALEGDKNFIMERMIKNEEKVDNIEKKVDETIVTVRVINRLFWIVIAAVATGAVGMIFIK
jgi:tetrahydromethanopterin S-methyltransferase subunit G